MRAVLPERWKTVGAAYLMRGLTAISGDATLPAGYHVSLEPEYGGYVAKILRASGEVAASGRIALHAGSAVFDQIVTEERYRRLGLGTVIMLTLDAIAKGADVKERLLVATEAGRALYESLGWSVLAPWSTAVLLVYEAPQTRMLDFHERATQDL